MLKALLLLALIHNSFHGGKCVCYTMVLELFTNIKRTLFNQIEGDCKLHAMYYKLHSLFHNN